MDEHSVAPAPCSKHTDGRLTLAFPLGRGRGSAAPGLFAGLVVLAAALLGGAPDAAAQCATCGNPAFVSGGKDIGGQLSDKPLAPWLLHSSLVWGMGGANTYYQNSEDVGNLDAFELSMNVLSLTASVRAPTGTEISAVLPWGRLRSKRRFHDEVIDTGLGDLEVRLRQDVLAPFGFVGGLWPQVNLSLGLAAPTGNYIEREDAFASKKQEVSTDPVCLTCGDFCPDHCKASKPSGADEGGAAGMAGSSDRYLNLGRGAWWFLADLDAAGRLVGPLGYYAAFSFRTALGRAPDGFGWGAEERWTAGLTGVIVPRWVTAQLLAEYERREMSTDGTDDNWVYFANGGGHFVNLSPTLQSSPLQGLSVSATLRWPLYRDVIGTQVAEGPSLWLSVSGTLGFGEEAAADKGAAADKNTPGAAARELKRSESPGIGRVGEPPGNPEIRALLVPGKITLVDYWAQWCTSCRRLGKDLNVFEEDGPKDVRVVRVEATHWKLKKFMRFIPDAPALPVLDIYDRQGKLIVRLSGEHVFGFRDLLPE